MKLSFTISLLSLSILIKAQSPRLSLFEEFTGENCIPCASYNPALNTLLLQPQNASKIISIKWQVPIPTAPGASWSLYQTNQTEIDWRYMGGGYGYQSQNMPTSPITLGINSAPTGRIDGQHLWAFGATSDHPYYMSDAVIASAQSYTSPFSISMARAWDATYSSINVTVNIQATANFTATGALVYRLVMTERTINFATAPGTNGETKFEDAARASFPSIQAGTSMASTWTIGQTQSFTLNCPLPAYIQNKAEVALVGFIQDDGNKKIQQAARADAIGTINDAKAMAINMPQIVCSAMASPSVTVKNFGHNAITSLTIVPYVDAIVGAPFQWAGNLAVGTSTTFNMNMITAAAGVHTYSYNISSVNGGADTYTGNNTLAQQFISAPNFFVPVAEPFTSASFPPANWSLINEDNGSSTWQRMSGVGAYGSTTGALKYDFQSNPVSSDRDELYLPPLNLSAMATPSLSFDLAYAQYGPSYSDGLEIKVSNDCGNSWTSVYNKVGVQLATTGIVAAPFMPASTDWITENISLAAFANDAQVFVKFCSFNDKGNNLYIDNINITQSGPTTIAKKMFPEMMLDIFPNPSSDLAYLLIGVDVAQKATLVATNALGQVVHTQELNLDSGLNKFEINTSAFANGVYQVIISSSQGSVVKKISAVK